MSNCETCATLEQRVKELEAERDRLKEDLELLVDLQNGPPLLREKDAWENAMRKAKEQLDGKP